LINRGISLPENPSVSPLRGARAPQAPLENLASYAAPPLTSGFSATDRAYDLRRALWDLSSLDRVRRCGRVIVGQDVAVVHSPERGSGFAGLETCGSTWADPVCSRKIAARRSVEIGTGLLEWERQGGALVMVTLTMRHHVGHRLGQELDALLPAWRRINGSQVWRKWLDRLGSPGLVRVVEVTWGANGWHAHLHFVLLVAGSTSAADVVALRDWLFSKWGREVARYGMPGALARGQDAHLVDGPTAADALGAYLAKDPAVALGRELTGAFTKGARSAHSTRSVWSALLGDFLVTGDADLLDRLHEYERVTKGRKQTHWSNGLRDRLSVGQEASDDDIVRESAGDDAVVLISREGWRTVLRLPEPTSRLLSVLNDGGQSALCDYLDARGVEYRRAELSVPAVRERS
jgi:hypothetical protein